MLEVRLDYTAVIEFLVEKYKKKLESDSFLVVEKFTDSIELPCGGQFDIKYESADDEIVLSTDKASLITIGANIPANSKMFDDFFNKMKYAIKKG